MTANGKVGSDHFEVLVYGSTAKFFMCGQFKAIEPFALKLGNG